FERGEKTPSAFTLQKWLVAVVKKEIPWYYDVSKCPPQHALIDLEAAFKNFHRLQKKSGYTLRDKKGRLQGLPNFKKKGRKDSFYLEGAVRIESGKIKRPRIGWVNLSEKIETDTIKNCVVSRKADQWFVASNIDFTP